MRKIIISVEGLEVPAVLNDSKTADAIWDNLPIEGAANVWGDEIYFDIAVEIEQEADARAGVEVGELGYWPMGSGFCIFFGPTPVSTDEKPKAYSPVNVFGRVTGDTELFKEVSQGAVVRVTSEL